MDFNPEGILYGSALAGIPQHKFQILKQTYVEPRRLKLLPLHEVNKIKEWLGNYSMLFSASWFRATDIIAESILGGNQAGKKILLCSTASPATF